VRLPPQCPVTADVHEVRSAVAGGSRRPTRRTGTHTPIRAGPSTLRTPVRASDTLRRAGRRTHHRRRRPV